MCWTGCFGMPLAVLAFRYMFTQLDHHEIIWLLMLEHNLAATKYE